MTALDHALRYAAAGWPVFPCRAGLKAPDTEHGFKDASTDPARIRRWWGGDPERNVAIATGAPGPDVLDVDVRPEGDGWAAYNRLKRAGLLAGAQAFVQTRSGGLHVYFAGTGQAGGKMARHHLDFKAAGGYVLAPPSFVVADDRGPAGRYEVLDHRPGTARLDWQACRDLLDPPAPRRDSRVTTKGSTARLIDWVARQNNPGDRHDPLKWAAFRLLEAGRLDDATAAELVGASVSAGHDERDAWACVRSIQRKAVAR